MSNEPPRVAALQEPLKGGVITAADKVASFGPIRGVAVWDHRWIFPS
jgi:hypothetical protein